VKRFLICLMIILLFLGGWYFLFPAEDVPRSNNGLNEKETFELEDKIGWYRAEDRTDWMITWSANSDLQLNCFKPLRNRRLTVLSDSCFQWQRTKKTTKICFQYDSTETVRSLSIADSSLQYMQRLPDKYYTQQEVRYFNLKDSLDFTATLLKPLGPAPHPVAVFVHGSGVSDRDNFWYLYQADFLAKQGIAVLLPDKRGCGKSQGEWHTSSIQNFSEDVLAAVDYLDRNGYADAHIGLVGFSQGGWVAPLAASRSDKVSFCIAVSASAFPPNQQLSYEIKTDIINSGAPSFIASMITPLFAYRVTQKRKRWWILNSDFDPMPYWGNLQIPVLMILGENDSQVWVEGSSNRFIKVVDESNVSSSEVKIYVGTGHAFIDPESGWIRQDYLEFMSSWILNQNQ